MQLHHPRRLALAALLALSISSTALAQTTTTLCPKELACVDYHGTTLQVDPKDGPIQYLVVEVSTTTITDLNGPVSRAKITLAELVAEGGPNSYAITQTYSFDRAGVFAGAEVGDTFGLIELVANS